jgi:hypothetical protein
MLDVRNRVYAAVLTFAFGLFPCGAQDASDVNLPEASEGNVNGLQGVTFVPETLVDGERRLVDASGCRVHLVPTDVDERLTYDCATWFAPPQGRYTVWLEQRDRLSNQTIFVYSGSKFDGHGMVVVMPLRDAGFAALSADAAVSDDQTVRFLSLEPSSRGFDKRLQASEAGSATRLPAGRAMAGVFDREGNALALSRPFSMKGGQTVTITPKSPVQATDLMVVLGKQRAKLQERGKRETAIGVRLGDGTRAPDVMYETDGRIIAVWYGLTHETATLTATSELFRSPEKTIHLSPGRVTTVREELTTK